MAFGNANIVKMQTISARVRDVLGKKVKNLRKEGFLPAVIYGNKKETTPIVMKETEFIKVWKSAGESSILQLEIDGTKENVLIHDIDFDPIKDNPIHADFLAVEMNKPIKVNVKIEFIGDSDAVKAGGSLVKVIHEIHIEALPKDLPSEIVVDISALKEMGGSIKIEDIKIPSGVIVLNNPSDMVAFVEAPKTEDELKAEEDAASGVSIETIEVVGKKEKEAEAAAEAEEKEEGKKKEA